MYGTYDASGQRIPFGSLKYRMPVRAAAGTSCTGAIAGMFLLGPLGMTVTIRA